MITKLSAALAALALLSTLLAQSTAFTYQGRLIDNGSPANGSYDFIFQVFDAASGGSSLDGSVNANAVGVSNGLFTVALDFGNSPFTGPQRWLQISVSTNDAGSFTTLAPRQENHDGTSPKVVRQSSLRPLPGRIAPQPIAAVRRPWV